MYVEKLTGHDVWDLHEHFTHFLHYYDVGDYSHSFDERVAPTLDRMRIFSSCTNVLSEDDPPDFLVEVGEHDYRFGLSYGWEGATFHQHNAWEVGKWRQDLTEAGFYSESDIFTFSQVTSIEEAARETQKQLDRLFAKLRHYRRTGLYRLEWEEVAALMRVVWQRYQIATDLHEELAGPDAAGYLGGSSYASLGGRRQGTIHLELFGRFDKSPLEIQASRDEYGWRIDIFSPYGVREGECPWMFCAMFMCEDRPDHAWEARCLLPHPTPHISGDAKIIDAWDLERFLFEEYFPEVIGRISRFKRAPLSWF